MSKKRRPPRPPSESREPREPRVSFSFADFQHRPPLTFAAGSERYPVVLTERLRALSRMTVGELKASRSSALRCHRIEWAETTQPNGFGHIPIDTDEDATPYQISVSANEHGRIHGFFAKHVFHIVWLDPAHALYARP